MKVNWKAALAALLLTGAAATAEEGNLNLSTVVADVNTRSYTKQAPAPSPSDAAPVVEPPAPLQTNDEYSHGGYLDPAPAVAAEPEAWTLFGKTPSGFNVGGWVSGGITFNADGNNTQNGNLGVPFNNVAGEFVANQVWIYGEKTVDTGGNGSDWGFRADYVFGADGPDTQAFGDQGWDFGWNSSSQYGSAIPQLYAEVAVNDLTVKIGRFFTPIGYEVVAAPGNFFYSHAMTQNYGEPFTHTGALASYTYSDDTTIYGGWTMGWDSGFDNFNNASTFLGGISHDINECTNLSWMVNVGDFGDGSQLRNGNNGVSGDIYMNSWVLQHELTDRLKYVFQHDLGVNSSVPGGANSEWYGINQYVIYTVTDCLSYGLRAEWFRDDDGARVGINTAGAGNYYNLTLGANYKPNSNIIFRPEIRYDKFDGVGNPYDNGTDNDILTAGFDAIFLF